MRDTLAPQEWFVVNRFILRLNEAKSPVLSLYLPSYAIAQGTKMLDVKENIIGLEEVRGIVTDILHRSKYQSGSLCLFGWSNKGQAIVEHMKISKEVPPIFVTQRRPYLKPLKDILEIGYRIVVIIMDHKRAKIEVFTGSNLVEEIVVRSYLKGRHSKGGWSQKRFKQNRELQIRYFFNKLSQQLKGLEEDNVELILLGGEGLAKKKFYSLMDDKVAQYTYIENGISFNTPRREIAKRVIAILDKVRKTTEKNILAGLASSAKDGLVITNNEEIEKKLAEGMVDKLFLAADYHSKSPKERSVIKRIITLAKRKGSTIEFITNPNARTGLHKFGNLVALLRYRI